MHPIVCFIFIILSIHNASISATLYPSTSRNIPNHRDHYLLSCGILSPATTSFDNQTWCTDDNSTFAPLEALAAATLAAPAQGTTLSAASRVPCSAARVFNSSFTYSFPVSPGPKFIRLNFCPATYNSIPSSRFFLTLKADGGAGPFTLLHNFSAYLHQQYDPTNSSSDDPVIEEFLLNVNASWLNLTFSPMSPDRLAFVNGIEIVSVPEGLYDGGFDVDPNRSTCGPVKNVNDPTSLWSVQEPVALQKVVRLNVGGSDVEAKNDAGEMFRTWISDDPFLDGFRGAVPNRKPIKIKYTASVPNYTAPDIVYWTARVMGQYNTTVKMSNNLTWAIPVDPGFDYLVRLHFCEIDHQITGDNQRVFNIYINNQPAERQADVMAWAYDVWGSPVCKDYVVTTNGGFDGNDATLGSPIPLWLALHPDVEGNPWQKDAILNGIEVFKLSLWNRSLAAPNPPPTGAAISPSQPSTPTSRSNSSSHLLPIIGVLIGGTALFFLIVFVFGWWWVKGKATRNTAKLSNGTLKDGSGSKAISSNGSSSLPSHLCKRFTVHEIKVATGNFDENMVIGVGGFGKVYKGSIHMDGEPTTATTMVAIKRLNPSSNQGALEFRTEIKMLTKLRHLNLVPLIGYCNDDPEMMLVYEYMPRGTLRDHLYTRYSKNQNPKPPLEWKERLKICIGAARGLQYLHGGAFHPIIHRDVKSTNILLDENWTAKLSDFGLSKVGPKGEAGEPNHVSTQVKGSIGYLDPEYHRLQQLSDKSDVYSFGVVLFEVLCARPAMISTLPKEEVNLAIWARSNYKNGTLDSIIDPSLMGQIAPECLKKFGEVAEMSVRNEGNERPSMRDVVWGLEFALQLQVTADNNENHINVGPGQGQGLAGGEFSSPNSVGNVWVGANACEEMIAGERFYQSINTNSLTTKSDIDDHMMGSGSVFSEIIRPKGR